MFNINLFLIVSLNLPFAGIRQRHQGNQERHLQRTQNHRRRFHSAGKGRGQGAAKECARPLQAQSQEDSAINLFSKTNIYIFY